ncbi:acyltransferase family protein [Azotosporobacter soli]|uniref:acyltransferase family protein n=1 Tax=Azotosporobacter soli TaxID=3055040 RepID=UPI0031FEF55C
MGAVKREVYIDYLRLLLIGLVVMQHLSVTYSGIGSWYYVEKAALGPVQQTVFLFFNSFNQSYFMGLLFFIAGCFVPGAYDRKGFWRFTADRFLRLGVPALFYMLLVQPLNLYILRTAGVWQQADFFAWYARYVSSFAFLGGSGPLWFAVALLIFSLFYALFRLLEGEANGSRPLCPLTTRYCIGLILLIAIVAFAIRLVQPIGTSILNMQFCFFSEYVFLFAAGIAASRNQWLAELRYEYGLKWLKAVLFLGIPCWIAVVIGGGVLRMQSIDVITGGWQWQAACYALLESFFGVGMSIGLLALFKEKCNRQSRFWQTLADNSFAVYVFHAPIIITLTLLLRDLQFWPLLKFALLSVLALPLCFALAHFVLRRLPLLKRIL